MPNSIAAPWPVAGTGFDATPHPDHAKPVTHNGAPRPSAREPAVHSGSVLNSESQAAAPPPDVAELTRAIRRGDPAAFSRFYDLYSFRIYRFLLVLTRGDEAEACEVCQAVFMKLAKRFDLFDEESQLWAWLRALAKNSFIDHYRARQKRNILLPLEDLPPVSGSEDHQSGLLAEIVRDALAALDPADRELIQAAYVEEQPLAEIAAGSGQTYKAVESRLGRLRQKLKEHLLNKLRNERKS